MNNSQHCHIFHSYTYWILNSKYPLQYVQRNS
nr:MAG TPA: hypothetical protein [Caudoviricetes sp.]